MKSGKFSKEKGKRGERLLAKWLQAHGYEAKRGQQQTGASGVADVVGLPGIHIECKNVEELNIPKAMEQAREDSYADSLKHDGYMIPTVWHKQGRKPWKVIIEAADFLWMIGRIDSDNRALLTMSAEDFISLYEEGGWS